MCDEPFDEILSLPRADSLANQVGTVKPLCLTPTLGISAGIQVARGVFRIRNADTCSEFLAGAERPHPRPYRHVPVPLSLNDSPGMETNCQEYDVDCSTSLSTPWTDPCSSLFGRLLEME